MKHTIILVIAVMILTTGCKKDLEIPNPNAPTTQEFWKSATDAQFGVNAIYSTFHRVGPSRWYYFETILRSDIGQSHSPAHRIVNNCDIFNITNYNEVYNHWIWRDYYIGINRANQVLDHVPDIDMDANLKKQLLGEAAFLRGYFYYRLATFFGNVPIILHTLSPTEYPATKPVDSVFAQVEQDLTFASANLPEKYGNADVGRATKGAALAFLGKAYMQQHKYLQAQQALEWIVEGGGKNIYKLVTNYRDNFLEATENNSESIFEVQNLMNPNDTHDDDIANGSDNLNFGSSVAPFFAPRPKGFLDAQAFRWIVWKFLEEKTIDDKRDPRLEATFLYDSTDERGPEYTMVYGQTWKSLNYSNNPNVEPNNFDVCFRKLLDDATSSTEVFHSGNNHRHARLGGILLLYAEALNALGKTDQAYVYVDMVRQRAGLAPLSVTKPGLSQAQFLEQLKRERLLELCGEGYRWEDLARWGELSTDLSVRDPAFSHFVKGRDELLPIPQHDIDINPNLVQNPGY